MVTNPIAKFLNELALAIDDARIACNSAVERATIALEELADVFLDPEPVPTPPDPGPDPPPEPPIGKRSPLGWNLGATHYWIPDSKPFVNKLLYNNIQFGRPDQQPLATFGKYGELLSGKANARVILSAQNCVPGTYQVLTGLGPTILKEFVVAATGESAVVDFNLEGPAPLLRCLRVGADATRVFEDTFIRRHRGSSVIRLMDMRLTNSPVAANGNHYRINQPAGGSPIMEETVDPAIAAAMALETGCDIWWNVHHLDTPEFIRECFQNFARVDGSFKVYVEFSNEIWNGDLSGGFPQAAYGMQQPGGRFEWQNRRTREIMADAKAILGDRAIGVIAGQALNMGVTQQITAGGLEGIDCLAIAPYLSYFDGRNPPPATESALIAAIRDRERTIVRSAILMQREFAADKGLRLICYEGGSDLNERAWPAFKDVFRKANRSEAMAEIYHEHIQWWLSEVSDVYCFYNTAHDHSYGHWDGERLAPQPRGKVIQDAIAATSSI